MEQVEKEYEGALGQKRHTHVHSWRLEADERFIRVFANPPSLAGIIVLLTILFLAVLGMFLLTYRFNPKDAIKYLPVFIIITIAVLGGNVFFIRKSVSDTGKAPFIIWDKNTGEVELPRQNKKIDAGKIVSFNIFCEPYGEESARAVLEFFVEQDDRSVLRYDVLVCDYYRGIKKAAKSLAKLTGRRLTKSDDYLSGKESSNRKVLFDPDGIS